LYQMKIQSVMVEGGARLLQSFIDAGIWDEARVISNRTMFAAGTNIGLPAPGLSSAKKVDEIHYLNDTIEYFVPLHENL
ncbi:MAG TPA: dihydrofolate reductase family protein, partial [Chitinophagaceae bacterium]|nr:dihydrofolate reductase family protein [Chitinophagaceae bacterium]